MSLKDLNEWNKVYGLSKVLLKNFVIGSYITLILIIGRLFMENRSLRRDKDKIQQQRIMDLKQFYKEKDYQDSLNKAFYRSYRMIKDNDNE